MKLFGIGLGVAAFIIIGIFHPIVIKAEYHLGRKSWWMFALGGVVSVVLSVLTAGNLLLSACLGVLGFSLFWSIHELFQQERRVLKGWFPENPARHDYYESKRRAEGYTPTTCYRE